MNAIFVSGLTILAATSALAATAAPDADADAGADADACNPRVIHSETKFPLRSQLRYHTGTVYMDVTIDGNGRASDVALERSSGHRTLDRAAQRSVVTDWVFDISTCERKDLPVNHLIAVEYRNAAY